MADFDIANYVSQTSGKLRDYKEWMKSTGTLMVLKSSSGLHWKIRSTHACYSHYLDYQSHWVSGQPTTEEEELYPLGYHDQGTQGYFISLFGQ